MHALFPISLDIVDDEHTSDKGQYFPRPSCSGTLQCFSLRLEPGYVHCGYVTRKITTRYILLNGGWASRLLPDLRLHLPNATKPSSFWFESKSGPQQDRIAIAIPILKLYFRSKRTLVAVQAESMNFSISRISHGIQVPTIGTLMPI